MRAPERDARRKRVIELHDRTSDSAQEIAARLGIQTGAVSALLRASGRAPRYDSGLSDRATVAAIRRNAPRVPGGLTQPTPRTRRA